MKVFVTGATGFVGGHLIDALHAKKIEHLGLARSLKKWEEFNLPGKPLTGNLEDLQKGALESWINELPDDLTHVVHTAGAIHTFNDETFKRVNLEATKDLFYALKKKYPKLHFVFVSSLASIGPSDNSSERDEASPLAPVSEYGKSKKSAENFLIAEKPLEWSLSIIRPPMVIGPRDPAILDVFKMVKGRFIFGNGLEGPDKLYSFVCVYDLITLIEKVLERDHRRVEIFLSAYPSNHTFREITETIAKLMNLKTFSIPIPFPLISGLANTIAAMNKLVNIDIRLTPDKIKELKPNAWTCSGKKSEEVLKMNYEWDLKKTLTTTLEDYLSRGWL